MPTPEPPLTPTDPAKLRLVAGSAEGTFNPSGAVYAVGTSRTVGSAHGVSAYTAAAAMAESPVQAAAYIEAEATMRAASPAHLVVMTADKEGRHGLLRQLGLESIPPDMASMLAGHELERRKWVKDKWVAVAIAAIAGLVAVVVALLR